MKPLFFVLLAASVAAPARAAGDEFLAPVAEIPAGSGVFLSRDGSVVAHAGESSIGVWRASDGRQTHRIALPPLDRGAGRAYADETVTDVSPDGRYALLSVTDRRDYKLADATVHLIDLEKETTRKLFTARRNCSHEKEKKPGELNMTICPWVTARFSPDGKRVLAVFSSDSKQSYRWDESLDRLHEAVLLDLDGKTLRSLKEAIRREPPRDAQARPTWNSVERNGIAWIHFGPDGHLRVAIDDAAGCEVRDLDAGTRVSFLDGFREGDRLEFPAPGIVVARSDQACKSVTKRWDEDTGKVRAIATDGCGSGAVFAADAGVALVEHGDAQGREIVELRRDPYDSVLFSSATSRSTGYYSWRISGDGSTLVEQIGGDPETAVVRRSGLAAKAAAGAAAAEARVDVDAVPPAAKPDPDAYALVVGVERYRAESIPAVDYASRDARAVHAYLTGPMGFDAKNVILMTGDQATRTDFEKNLKWLRNRAGAKSRVFVYYAGHGAPNPSTGEGYLMPYEADPNYLEETAFPVAKLYAELAKLPTKDVSVVLDACFSGQGGRSLIAQGARPLVSVRQAKGPANAVVLAAASSSQISASDPQSRHGLLTYWLLAGLKGGADARGDGRITADELYAFVRPAVERSARLQNVEQTPTVSPSPEDLKAAPGRPWIVIPVKK